MPFAHRDSGGLGFRATLNPEPIIGYSRSLPKFCAQHPQIEGIGLKLGLAELIL